MNKTFSPRIFSELIINAACKEPYLKEIFNEVFKKNLGV